ncbi:MAG: Gmad2 immunoglobulin-like domain-containing protein [Patescibacteria group bacterium]
MKKLLLVILSILIVVAAGLAVLYCKNSRKIAAGVTNFDECAAAGHPILESYPRSCKTPDNRTFTEYIGNELEKQNLIRISTPRPNTLVSSPLVVTGEARGFWFFEASFPVKILDSNGVELGIGIAQAKSDWMTENFVPFEATLEFAMPTVKNGILILERDNPSGLPENADSLSVPVKFSN